jgi:hypothetical protein
MSIPWIGVRHAGDRQSSQTRERPAMTEYLITIHGDEAVWDARTEEERRMVGEAHGDFVATLTQRGHRVTAGGELTALAEAKVVRRKDRGSLVTDGPYAEAAEQVGGFYLVESDDLDDLLAIIGQLVATEPVVELRPIHGRTTDSPA